MKQIPTTWDETRFIEGYPAKYIVLARRHGDKWYLAAINAMEEPLKLKFSFPELSGSTVSAYTDDKKMQPQLKTQKIKEKGEFQLTVQPLGGAVWVK